LIFDPSWHRLWRDDAAMMKAEITVAVRKIRDAEDFFLAPYRALTSQRTLTFELTKRDILGRYRGASFGLLWSLISPFLMLLIYTFAFGFVFKSKWPQEVGGDHPFAIILYSGSVSRMY